MEKVKTEQLFGELFGFRAGDRVKVRINTWSKNGFWEYLVIEGKEEIWGKEFYRVRKSRNPFFSFLVHGKDLVRCRKYVKKKFR